LIQLAKSGKIGAKEAVAALGFLATFDATNKVTIHEALRRPAAESDQTVPPGKSNRVRADQENVDKWSGSGSPDLMRVGDTNADPNKDNGGPSRRLNARRGYNALVEGSARASERSSAGQISAQGSAPWAWNAPPQGYVDSGHDTDSREI